MTVKSQHLVSVPHGKKPIIKILLENQYYFYIAFEGKAHGSSEGSPRHKRARSFLTQAGRRERQGEAALFLAA